MKILPYKASDTKEIIELFTQVFSDSEGPTEGNIIGTLVGELITTTERRDIYGYIATENSQIVGTIFFSRLTFPNKINAFLLSPVAIHTNFQRQGVGQRLINYGINSLREDGVKIVVTYGDPRFYEKVGFSHIESDVVEAPFVLSQSEGWLGQSLVGETIEPIAGKSMCVAALNKPDYW